jgi:peptide deformylase
MARLTIIYAPDPRLKMKCAPVERVDAEVRRLMDDMLETMHAAPGVGLAAPQVGVLRRVIVVDTARHDEEPRPLRMANPQVLWRSQDEALNEEGCLSFPDQYAEVARPDRVRVRYIDHENEIREIEADGLVARCIQHEIDHLDGVTFVDRLSILKRGIILRKMRKAKRLQHETVAAE